MNSSQIVVVDPRSADYDALAPYLEADKFQVHFFPDGRSALGSSRQLRSALWMINVDLPDRSGLDVFKMVSTAVRGPIFLVADRYQRQQERAALALGGAMYLCKPLQFDWIDQIRLSLPTKCVRSAIPTGDSRLSRPTQRLSAGNVRQRVADEFRRYWRIDVPIGWTY